MSWRAEPGERKKIFPNIPVPRAGIFNFAQFTSRSLAAVNSPNLPFEIAPTAASEDQIVQPWQPASCLWMNKGKDGRAEPQPPCHVGISCRSRKSCHIELCHSRVP